MTIEDRPTVDAPAPTTDLDQARRDLEATGLCVVADVLTGDALTEVRDAAYRAAASDRRRGRVQRFGGDFDVTNQRVWNLPSRDPVFLDVVEHPLALSFVREVIGWPALLSNISANLTGPGGGEMYFHCDQFYMPQPWSGVQGINMIWCVDDFTEDNGATRVVPGSHALNRPPLQDDRLVATVPLEARRGSMVVMDGRVWHRTGTNRTRDEHRCGLFAWYTPPIYLPQENWWLSLDPSVRLFGSDELLTLFGFKATSFGRVYDRSPA
ncbi:MAG TPA: phytanoyl-CoA dioxygenase family protein [Acidimicrobiales bacterium]